MASRHISYAPSSGLTPTPTPGPSFLFIANELTTNDDPGTQGSIEARYVKQRWLPPQSPRGFLPQQIGRVYRWNNGVVSHAESYKWDPRQVGDPPHATGSIYKPSSEGIILPTIFRAASVFFCNHFDKFFTAQGDAGTINVEETENDWYPLSFYHDGNLSLVAHAGSKEYLNVRSASWISELLPKTYRRISHSGPNSGGLGGILPILIALVAFSCKDSEALHDVLLQDGAWSNHQWIAHQRPTGRIERRGVVVTVYLDPENPLGSTHESILNVEDGPVFQ